MYRTREKKPEEVFVPRSAEVDLKSYISRAELEKELLRAVKGSKNILLTNGKGDRGDLWRTNNSGIFNCNGGQRNTYFAKW